MNKILIIGGSGYIGSRLCDILLEYDYNIKVLDTGYYENIHLSKKNKHILIKEDIRKFDLNLIEFYDVVIMLAAISNDTEGSLNTNKIYSDTVDFTIKVAQKCKSFGKKFIFPSSCSVYGKSSSAVSEDDNIFPQTPYSHSKVAIENELKKISDNNFNPIILRISTVFGYSTNMRFDLVINMLCGLAVTQNKIVLNSDGSAWRPFVYIDDLCEVFKKCIELEKQEENFTIFNVGNDKNNFQILHLAKIISKMNDNCEISFLNNLSSNKSNLIDNSFNSVFVGSRDQRNYKVNFNKINTIFNKSLCTTSVVDGISKTIKNLKKNNITQELFNNTIFYRVNHIEYLFNSGKINKNLLWE